MLSIVLCVPLLQIYKANVFNDFPCQGVNIGSILITFIFSLKQCLIPHDYCALAFLLVKIGWKRLISRIGVFFCSNYKLDSPVLLAWVRIPVILSCELCSSGVILVKGQFHKAFFWIWWLYTYVVSSYQGILKYHKTRLNKTGFPNNMEGCNTEHFQHSHYASRLWNGGAGVPLPFHLFKRLDAIFALCHRYCPKQLIKGYRLWQH